jgi:class 3 adenylate cyclase
VKLEFVLGERAGASTRQAHLMLPEFTGDPTSAPLPLPRPPLAPAHQAQVGAPCRARGTAIAEPLGELAVSQLQGAAYRREFGVVPDFRAGLHCGPVAVGELGSLRREIALIGDTMNTTARILEACRDTDNRVLASVALIERLATLPPGVCR